MSANGRTEKDLPTERRYYTTGQIARELGVSVSNIRYWLDWFGLSSIKRNYSNRKIPVATYETLVSIHKLSMEGFYTLKGIARELQLPTPKLLPNGTSTNTTESPTVLGELRPGHGAETPAANGAARSSENQDDPSQGGGVLREQSPMGSPLGG